MAQYPSPSILIVALKILTGRPENLQSGKPGDREATLVPSLSSAAMFGRFFFLQLLHENDHFFEGPASSLLIARSTELIVCIKKLIVRCSQFTHQAYIRLHSRLCPKEVVGT